MKFYLFLAATCSLVAILDYAAGHRETPPLWIMLTGVWLELASNQFRKSNRP